MSPMPPALRFLPGAELEKGPFGLLGVQPDCDQRTLEEALRRQLERVARHPHGATVEADEVRLALHVAAAQLRDPAVRSELLEELSVLAAGKAPLNAGATENGQPGAAASTGETSLRPAAPANPAFDHAAMWVIAHSGGWNAEAKRRLWALAHATDVSPADLPHVVARVASRSSRVSARRSATTGRPARAVPLPQEVTPLRKWAPLVAVVVMSLSSVVMLRFIAVLQKRDLRQQTIVLEGLPSSPPAADAPMPREIGADASPKPGPTVDPPAQPTLPTPRRDAGPATLTSDAPQAPAAPLDPALEAAEAWLEDADVVLKSSLHKGSPLERLHQATRLATMHCAAEQHVAGMLDLAETTRAEARQLRTPSPGSRPSASDLEAQLFRMTAPATSDDGRVAMQFQLARRQPSSSMETINRLRFRQTPLGPADCDVIAEVALFAPTMELRAVARRFVDDQSDNPFMLYGLLSAVDRAPKNRSSAELLERLSGRALPPTSDPTWALKARAALLARLMQLIAADRVPVVDDLADRLLSAYALGAAAAAPAKPRLPFEEAPPESEWSQPTSFEATDPDQPPDADAAARLVEIWRSRADAYRSDASRVRQLDTLLRRGDARIALAQGPVQRFAAEQAMIVDLAAFVIARERMTLAGDVARVFEEYASERREARHVFEQIESGERAMVRLWRIRFGATIDAGRGRSS